MNIEDLSGLPEWDEDDFEDGDREGEEWKPRPTGEAAKAMYEQWKQVMVLLGGVLEDDNEDYDKKKDGDVEKEMFRDMKGMIMGDAFQVAVKIKSSETGLYIIRMDNAAIIRKNAQFIKTSMMGLIADGSIDEEHAMVIRAEIDKFRLLFKHWVSTFEKDDIEDDWGLF
jgi:hypothetical protein